MNRKGILAILLVFCLLIGAACGSKKPSTHGDATETEGKTNEESQTSEQTNESGKMLVAGIGFGLDSFDPQYSWNMFCTRQVYDTLLSTDEEDLLVPNIALDWNVSDDGKTYTFSLREDVKFSNGDPLTSEDCVYTFTRALESSYVNAHFTSENISSLEAPDEYTFVINLQTPNPSFLMSLTNTSSGAPYGGIVSKTAVENWGDQFGLSQDTVMGSGPYKLVEWVVNEYAIFEVNENYWGEKPTIEKFKMIMMQDTSAALIALETNEMDIYLSDLLTTDIPIIEANDAIQLSTYAAPRIYYFVLNVADGACKDPIIRQAIQLAVDREKLNTLVTDGYGEIIDQLGGWDFQANPGHHNWPKQDIETAKELIDTNGLSGTVVTLKSQNTGAYPDILTSIKQDLEDIGLVCDIQTQERATWVEDVCQNGNFDISVVQWAADPDMDVMYSLLHTSGSGNYGGYSNSDVDAYLEDARLHDEADERANVYSKIIEIATEEVPAIPLFTAVAVRSYGNSVGCDGKYITHDCMYYYYWK